MDAAKFKREVIPHCQAMYRAAFSIMRNTEDAEDVVQDTLTKLWNNRNRVTGQTQSYYVAAARHTAIDAIRRRHITADLDSEALQISEIAHADTLMQGEDVTRIFRQALNSMPANTSKVMSLRVFSECSLEEIEQITGLSSGNIRTLLSRARKRLREIYNLNEK